MRDARHPPPTEPDHPVWHALRDYRIGTDDAALNFAARLARDNGWSAAMAERAIAEYRRFAFLAATAGEAMTPSDAVDQVWHLHLSYSHDYWDRFCPQILGRALHHGPTLGGETERSRFFEQYAQTLLRYEAAFGPPPDDLWPAAGRRLLDDPRARRVHPRDGIVVPRPLVYVAIALLVILAMT